MAVRRVHHHVRELRERNLAPDAPGRGASWGSGRCLGAGGPSAGVTGVGRLCFGFLGLALGVGASEVSFNLGCALVLAVMAVNRGTWDHPSMRLIADGTTPTSRLVLVNDLETDAGYAFELNAPLFLAAGDRISFENSQLVVVREGGDRILPAGSWATRCRIGYAPDGAASSA